MPPRVKATAVERAAREPRKPAAKDKDSARDEALASLRAASKEEREVAAALIVAWLGEHKKNKTMTRWERELAWHDVAGGLGVGDDLALVTKDGTSKWAIPNNLRRGK